MSYRLFRLSDPDDSHQDGVYLGEFPSFEAALEARDEDTVQLFAGTFPGHVLTAHHQILGTGELGALSPHPISVCVPRRTATATEVADTRRWLDWIHAQTRT